MRTSTTRRAARPARRYASPAYVGFLASLSLVVAVLVPIGSVAYALNAATRAGAEVVTPVFVRDAAALETALVTGPVPSTRVLPVDDNQVVLRPTGATVAEQLLSRADAAAVGLCWGLGGLLLGRMLRAVARGEPLHHDNARRAAGIAALIVLGGLASDLLPVLGANVVLRRLELSGPDSPAHAMVVLDLGPAMVAALVLVLAEVFRRGHEDTRDAAGLV